MVVKMSEAMASGGSLLPYVASVILPDNCVMYCSVLAYVSLNESNYNSCETQHVPRTNLTMKMNMLIVA